MKDLEEQIKTLKQSVEDLSIENGRLKKQLTNRIVVEGVDLIDFLKEENERLKKEINEACTKCNKLQEENFELLQEIDRHKKVLETFNNFIHYVQTNCNTN